MAPPGKVPAMRAILVVNPSATSTTTRSRDVLVQALRSQVDLQVAYTERRGHGIEIARRAAQDGIDLVAVLGGDGTVNEVANGLMTADDGADAGRADERPAMTVVPGGSTNVFARALGLPRDWAEGTGIILEALREGRTRRVGLGRADERYFTFCAGLGIDAEVVARVENARRRGATAKAALYLRSALTQYVLTDARRPPAITLEDSEEPPEGPLATVIVQNTAPWTYLRERAVHGCPDAAFDRGLDVLALRELAPAGTIVTAARMLGRRGDLRGKQVLRRHDLPGFTLRSTVPIALQVDGEYVGERQKLDFASIPDALRIVC